jgi:glycosyltransferase involved in cell wall biosynthesis
MATANYLPVMGGVETHVAEVVSRLPARGIEPVVVTTDVGGRLPPRAVIDGVSVVRVPALAAAGDLHVAPGLVDAIHREQPDLVHVQGYHTLVPPAAMIAARSGSVRWVVTFHSGGHASPVRNRLRRLQVVAQRPLLSRATALIAVSQFEAMLFASWLGLPQRRVLVIPNGARRPPTASSSAPPPQILSIGRLERYKGHDRAIAAMPAILARRPDAHLRILGTGPDEARLRALAAGLGVAGRVELGAVPAGDTAAMDRALAGAHVVVAFSDYESQGLAALDALAAGRRVIVADRTALHELVVRGWAAGVRDPDDPAAVSDAIVRALEQPLPDEVPTGIPSWDDCADRLATIYHRIAAVRA